MKKALIKDFFKEIANNKKRFISIILIIVLGVGFYAGIKFATPAMQYTVDKYLDNQNFMDFKLISEYGITKENVDKIKEEEYIKNVMPSYSKDVIMQTELKGKKKYVVKVHSIPNNINDTYLNRLAIEEGTLPSNEKEIAIDKRIANNLKIKIGDNINLDDQDFLKNKEYTVTAIVNSPSYISVDRGSTTLASGQVAGFCFVKEDEIKQDIYTEVFITVKGLDKYNTFSEVYEKEIKKVEEKINTLGESISQSRYENVKEEANKEVIDGEEELNKSKEEKENKEKEAREKLEKAEKEINNSEKKIIASEKDTNNKFKVAEKQLLDAQNKIKNGENKLQEEKNKLQPEKEKLEASINEIKNGQETVNNNLNKLNSAKNEIEKGIKIQNEVIFNIDKQIENINKQLETREEELKTLNEKLEELNKKLENVTEEEKEKIKLEIEKVKLQIEYLKTLESQKAILISTKTKISEEITKLKQNLDEINKNVEILNQKNNELETNRIKLENILNDANKKIQDAEKEINSSKNELQKQKSNLQTQKKLAISKIVSAKSQLQDAKNKLEEGRKTLDKEIEEANKKIDEAELKLKDAREEIKKIESPEFYALGRDKNIGFEEYKQNTFKIDAIAKIFPIVFFVVAALVCLTSMTRMVEEQRLQIGTLKSLGYNNREIINKYIMYGLLASIIGCIIGILIGVNLIPRVIANAYAIMYEVPKVEIPINYTIVLTTSLIAIAIIVISTYYACKQELSEVPAALMRPKAPKKGKRIFLEKIPFIWEKLNFIQKVTARNIFRYKKKFYMTIIGIAGCTALVVTGFGIKDSVSALVPKQFEKIFNYDMQVMINDNITSNEYKNIEENIKTLDKVSDYTRVKFVSNKVKNNDVSRDAYIVIPEDAKTLEKQVDFKNRITKEKIPFENDSVIITEKLAKILNVKKGDNILLEVTKNNFKEFKVTAITENYVGHYIYIAKDLYENVSNETVNYNNIYVQANDLTEEEENKFSENLLKNENILSISFLSKMKLDMEETFNSLNKIVTILIVAASLLALVVLYNLSNINISERVRELATIKVLGFYDKEVSDYIHRESKYLTIIGIVLGLIGGFFLEAYVIKTCEVDMVMFMPDIKFISYIYAIIVTLVSTFIVNIFVYFSLKKIDMIESLKSVE